MKDTKQKSTLVNDSTEKTPSNIGDLFKQWESQDREALAIQFLRSEFYRSARVELDKGFKGIASALGKELYGKKS